MGVTVSVFHPGLEAMVIEHDRPFPEITEEPGYPIQPEFNEAFQPVIAEFAGRFATENAVPLLAHFGQFGEDFEAVVQAPEDFALRAHYFELTHKAYHTISFSAHGAQLRGISETPQFSYGDGTMHVDLSTGGFVSAKMDQPTYRFAHCAGLGIHLSTSNMHSLQEQAGFLKTFFEQQVTGDELKDADLTDKQREHFYWMGVILQGFFVKHEEACWEGSWISRAPEPELLSKYRDELASDLPDAKSAEMVPAICGLARAVADMRIPEPKRIGEEYTIVD